MGNSLRRGVRDRRILVVGDGGAGKSCLTLQFFLGTPYLPYLSDGGDESFRKQVTVDGETCNLVVTDFSGVDVSLPRLQDNEGFLFMTSPLVALLTL